VDPIRETTLKQGCRQAGGKEAASGEEEAASGKEAADRGRKSLPQRHQGQPLSHVVDAISRQCQDDSCKQGLTRWKPVDIGSAKGRKRLLVLGSRN
jgi:hypothetical protein